MLTAYNETPIREALQGALRDSDIDTPTGAGVELMLNLLRGVYGDDTDSFYRWLTDEGEAEFDWTFGPWCTYGDHPDLGGGIRVRDIERVELSAAFGLDATFWRKIMGRGWVDGFAEWAMHNTDEPAEDYEGYDEWA